jgi:hypothetical protein
VATPIYHITHVDNLRRIVQTSGLWCDAERERQGFESVEIAHQSLKERRSAHPVPVAARGTLADYVPFYFANRSPMLFAIHRGFVDGYAGGQADIVYLMTTAERVACGDRAWYFTDGHAVMAMSGCYERLDDLDKVDWGVICSWSWRDTDNDPDRKRRKQAEFLVHRSVPWNWFETLAVIDRNAARRVEQALQTASYRPAVRIERKWYY